MENTNHHQTKGERLYKVTLTPCRNKKQLQNGNRYVVKLCINKVNLNNTNAANNVIENIRLYFADRQAAMRRFLFLTYHGI